MRITFPSTALALLLIALSPSCANTGTRSDPGVPVTIQTGYAPTPGGSIPNGADRAGLKNYNLGGKKLAIKGYDPVSYFPKFGGKASKGSKKITAKHRGVLYRFASDANRKAFLQDPDRFEPAYGGWCAWAMADGKGSKVGVNPRSFTVENGVLYIFYDGLFGDTRKSWNKKGSALKLKAGADTNWSRISGESKRLTDTEKKKKGAA